MQEQRTWQIHRTEIYWCGWKKTGGNKMNLENRSQIMKGLIKTCRHLNLFAFKCKRNQEFDEISSKTTLTAMLITN